MRFFFYGTLLDAEVRQAVMPHLAERLWLEPARLRGYRRVKARHGSYPVLLADPRGAVEGLLASGLDARALFRLAQFEGDRYLPQRCRLRSRAGESCEAWAFMPLRAGAGTPQSWCLRRWRSRHKRRLLADTTRWMREFGADSGEAHDMSWPFRRRIRALAAELEAGEWRRRLRRAA